MVSLIFQWILPKIVFPLASSAYYPQKGRSMRAHTGSKAADVVNDFILVNVADVSINSHSKIQQTKDAWLIRCDETQRSFCLDL